MQQQSGEVQSRAEQCRAEQGSHNSEACRRLRRPAQPSPAQRHLPVADQHPGRFREDVADALLRKGWGKRARSAGPRSSRSRPTAVIVPLAPPANNTQHGRAARRCACKREPARHRRPAHLLPNVACIGCAGAAGCHAGLSRCPGPCSRCLGDDLGHILTVGARVARRRLLLLGGPCRRHAAPPPAPRRLLPLAGWQGCCPAQREGRDS